MKQVFVDLRPWDKELAIAALESGADGVIAESAGPVRELGRILVIAPDGDLIPEQDIHEITIENTGDQARAMEAAKCIGSRKSTGAMPLAFATAGVNAANAKKGALPLPMTMLDTAIIATMTSIMSIGLKPAF